MDFKLDPRQSDAWLAFLKTHAAVIRALEREMWEEQGLPLTWYEVLAKLSFAPEGRIRMQVLAEAILFSQSGLTRLIDRMVKAGLVRRRSSRKDRRGTYVLITPEGRAILERVMPGHARRIRERFFHHLDDEDVRALYRVLSKVLEAGSVEGKGDRAA